MATAIETRFELTGADGGPLRGEVRTADRSTGWPAVIICHGFKGFRDWGFFPVLSARLARAGLTTVTFNFSGSGVGPDGESFNEPERFARDTFSRQLTDLATIRAALGEGRLVPGLARPGRLGLFGHSRGGGVAVLHASRQPVDALVTWASISSTLRWSPETIAGWRAKGTLDVVNARTGQVLQMSTEILDDIERNRERLDVAVAAAAVTAPWLILHGEADEAVSADEAERLRVASGRMTTRMEIVAGGSHTFGARHPWAGSTPELDRAMDSTVEWFGKWLL